MKCFEDIFNILILSLMLANSLKFTIKSSSISKLRAVSTGKIAANTLALDFDGVVCASSFESSLTAINAMETIWPEKYRINDVKLQTKLQNAIMEMRPVYQIIFKYNMIVNSIVLIKIVETGYENILLARYILSELSSHGSVDTAKLLDTWNSEFRDELLNKFGVSKEFLVEEFGRARLLDNF